MKPKHKMNYLLDLKNNEHIIRDYLRGYSLEDISLKYELNVNIVDGVIDLYNWWYN